MRLSAMCVCLLARLLKNAWMDLEWFYSVARRNNFVGGTCAPPSGECPSSCLLIS